MPTAKSSNPYRNDKYCDIPYTNYGCSTGGCCGGNNRPVSILIETPLEDIFLACGCLAFEYRSHLPNCKFYNETEDQPYYPGCLS